MERISVKLSALQKKTISEVQKASIWTTHRVQFSTPISVQKNQYLNEPIVAISLTLYKDDSEFRIQCSYFFRTSLKNS